MKFFVEIDIGNAAFENNVESEIKRILKTIPFTVANATMPVKFPIFDRNGNRVGYFGLRNDDKLKRSGMNGLET